MSETATWHREFKPGDHRIWHRCPGCGRPILARSGAAARVWEKQKRGLAHLHGVLSVSRRSCGGRRHTSTRWPTSPLKGVRLRRRLGEDPKEDQPGIEAAAYLSSYFVNGKGRKASLTENVLDADHPRLLVFIGRGLTTKTACMRNLRLARRLWASRQGLTTKPELTYPEWLAVAHVLDSRRRGP